jgi:hypothetical protein
VGVQAMENVWKDLSYAWWRSANNSPYLV